MPWNDCCPADWEDCFFEDWEDCEWRRCFDVARTLRDRKAKLRFGVKKGVTMVEHFRKPYYDSWSGKP